LLALLAAPGRHVQWRPRAFFLERNVLLNPSNFTCKGRNQSPLPASPLPTSNSLSRSVIFVRLLFSPNQMRDRDEDNFNGG
jgi:hypothetical protein